VEDIEAVAVTDYERHRDLLDSRSLGRSFSHACGTYSNTQVLIEVITILLSFIATVSLAGGIQPCVYILAPTDLSEAHFYAFEGRHRRPGTRDQGEFL